MQIYPLSRSIIEKRYISGTMAAAAQAVAR